ncbi:hypothetical protein BGZ49_006479 [Haplosporangium sp. Z 27]|nr:hypothetical protein BGZ49_006479 [Haplosporangium sp. Z 27]
MRFHDPSTKPISAPILVPGSQQEPTAPLIMSLGCVGGCLTNTLHVGPPRLRGLNSTNSNTNLYTNPKNNPTNSKPHINVNQNNPNNINSGLRRFPALIGNAGKKLIAENTVLRAKNTELERYVTGLKKELLQSRIQIQTKNEETKADQDQKSVEIHELIQHIQRCESDLLAKSAECEALQNKLQYQAKDQLSKLKLIALLESELLDYKRMSTLGSSDVVNSAALRVSRNIIDLLENTRSLIVFAGNNNALGNEEAMIQIRQLKDENARKDGQLEKLMDIVEKLKAEASQPEKQQQQRQKTPSRQSASVSSSDESIGNESIDKSSSSDCSSVNSVGYDTPAEHPKLILRYQALQMQRAQVSEYLEALESESHDLRVQLLNISLDPNLNFSTESESAIPSSSTNSLHHPKASKPSPLNIDSFAAVPSASSTTPTTTIMTSPTSASTSHYSPSTTIAPTLTRKSSLRYPRDGQGSSTTATA